MGQGTVGGSRSGSLATAPPPPKKKNNSLETIISRGWFLTLAQFESVFKPEEVYPSVVSYSAVHRIYEGTSDVL